jgi:hypothetical protein
LVAGLFSKMLLVQKANTVGMLTGGANK